MLSKDMDIVKKYKVEESTRDKRKEVKRKFKAEKKDMDATRKLTWSTVQEDLLSDKPMDECVSPSDDKESDIYDHQKCKKKVTWLPLLLFFHWTKIY